MAVRRFGNSQRRREREAQESFFDYTMLFIVLFLLAFGLVMLYSASAYDASLHYEGDSTYFLRRQVGATALGIAAMIVVANIPYHFWERFAVMGVAVSIGLIFLIIFGVLSMFIPALDVLDRVVCLVGIAIFLGYTAYDTQKIKAFYNYYSMSPDMLAKASIFSALQLYLDFINLFLYLLRFLGNKRR